MSSNENKNKQLGMPFGTACGKLRKLIMFDLLKELNRNYCFCCNKEIKSVEELSIEHKKPWLNVDVGLFWDLSNIAFSHLHCNCVRRDGITLRDTVEHGNRSKGYYHGCKCQPCKDANAEYIRQRRSSSVEQ